MILIRKMNCMYKHNYYIINYYHVIFTTIQHAGDTQRWDHCKKLMATSWSFYNSLKLISIQTDTLVAQQFEDIGITGND